MEFKVGDIIKMKGNCTGGTKGEIYEIGINKSGELAIKLNNDYMGCTCSGNDTQHSHCLWELISSKEQKILPENTMKKKVIQVIVVNKKSGKVEKNETVTAQDENQAVLKAYGVNLEDVQIKTNVIDEYEETAKQVPVEVKVTK